MNQKKAKALRKLARKILPNHTPEAIKAVLKKVKKANSKHQRGLTQ